MVSDSEPTKIFEAPSRPPLGAKSVQWFSCDDSCCNEFDGSFHGGRLEAPLYPLKPDVSRGRPVFQGGQAPSGLPVIRPLVQWSHPLSALQSGPLYFYVDLLYAHARPEQGCTCTDADTETILISHLTSSHLSAGLTFGMSSEKNAHYKLLSPVYLADKH